MRKLIVLLALVLMSCAGVPPQTSAEYNVETKEISFGITRVMDKEAGVVCWLYYSSGISCMPIESTLLVR